MEPVDAILVEIAFLRRPVANLVDREAHDFLLARDRLELLDGRLEANEALDGHSADGAAPTILLDSEEQGRIGKRNLARVT